MNQRFRNLRVSAGCLVGAFGITFAATAVWADGSEASPIYLAAADSPLVGVKDGIGAKHDRDLPSVAARSKSAVDVHSPVFIPRTSRGAPAARIGGASRSGSPGLVVLALVPQHDGAALTTTAQPTLYWHLSKPTEHAVNFTLIEPDAIDPILDVTIEGPFEAGVQEIDLTAHDASLETGRSYLWFVAVVPDPDRRSADIVARGAVERVLPQPDVEADDAVALAKAGIWYDALAATAGPQRTALLAQVGIEF